MSASGPLSIQDLLDESASSLTGLLIVLAPLAQFGLIAPSPDAGEELRLTATPLGRGVSLAATKSQIQSTAAALLDRDGGDEADDTGGDEDDDAGSAELPPEPPSGM